MLFSVTEIENQEYLVLLVVYSRVYEELKGFKMLIRSRLLGCCH